VRFGFNALRAAHLATLGKLDALEPDTFRVGLIEHDPAYWVVDDLVGHLGLRPLVHIYGKQAWPDPDLWAEIAAEIVRRHPDAIIQVGNEPNSPDFGAVAPARMRDVTNAVTAAVPDGTGVYGPAMNPLEGWEAYMKTAYTGTTAKPSLHLYPRKTIVKTVDAAFDVAEEFGTVQVTECGCPRDSWPKQGDATRKLYEAIRDRGAGTCIFHTAYELPNMGEWEERSRLWFIRADGTRTGLFNAIAGVR
jgi:hypothetical protein